MKIIVHVISNLTFEYLMDLYVGQISNDNDLQKNELYDKDIALQSSEKQYRLKSSLADIIAHRFP
jgi:hypothetical protein